MNNLNQVFYLTKESIGVLDNSEMSDELKKIGSKNQKDFPKWISEFAVQPVPILATASVDRFTLEVPGAQTAFIDIHEIDDAFYYAKIFFLFGIHQFIKNSSYEKNIDSLMHENCGSPDMRASLQLKPIVGKDCLLYDSGDAVIVTNHSIVLTQKEFQIHIYEPEFFVLLFPWYIPNY
jgi:hypothetical protein